ncbi:Aste57867_17066 [Aphanomyces stellatus]|uniref:Aste57867_17066 protein n=1 Tax=Aphanomyces stellatus TaxID=120398 RepID=A0A485L840_9STRA|nr:hypothetical protein As57867_017008 [Aphanomyces stellatus]VFT93827.1 Aste57867_17066 [Aphanomyces stellatus]
MDDFSLQVRARIRLHRVLKEDKKPLQAPNVMSDATIHHPGQAGCFCRECLVFRKNEWRIGDLNPLVVGPRNQWVLYCWGDGERGALGTCATENIVEPYLVPPIMEQLTVEDASNRRWKIEREAKFTAMASGKYHTLLLTESQQLFACGDNSYLNLCAHVDPGMDPCDNLSTTPTSLMDKFRNLGQSRIVSIACSEYASFVLVDKPIDDDDSGHQMRNELDMLKGTKKKAKENEQREPNDHNHGAAPKETRTDVHLVYSWGRGDRGVLGHGSTASESLPRLVEVLNYYRVVQIAAGRDHVLALTELGGVFSFGSGNYGKLGLGDTKDVLVPTHIDYLEGVHVTAVSAGDDFSAILTDTAGSRQVFMWGKGEHGVLGNGDVVDKWKPTRVNALRGKVRMLSCGGAHTLLVAEATSTRVAKGATVVLSWGQNTYGQLGHRDNWDVHVPKIVDEIASHRITFVSAGARHSLALATDLGTVWAWGHGIHGHQPDHREKEWTSSALFFPRQIRLADLHVIGGVAGRGRTFVWGDRATFHASERPKADIDTLSGASQCSASAESKLLSSNCLRVSYRCGTCHLSTVCVVCAAKCHAAHCLELQWTMTDCLSKACDCAASGKCTLADGDRDDGGSTRNI